MRNALLSGTNMAARANQQYNVLVYIYNCCCGFYDDRVLLAYLYLSWSSLSSPDTCRCFKRITTNYRIFSPYNSVQISPDLKKVNMSGMIPEILNNLTVECCQTCKSHGLSYVDFVQNGRNMSAFQHNEMDVIDLIDDSNDLSFPVYGWKWQDRYQGIYRYIPLVESPGFAFLLLAPDTESPFRAILRSIFETWPYILITVVMALIAGIIMWFMVCIDSDSVLSCWYYGGVQVVWIFFYTVSKLHSIPLK